LIAMQVYLLRHGIAEPPRPGLDDPGRALLPEGKKRLRAVLRAAKAAGVQPALVMTSPYRRAKETAEIAAKSLGYADEIVTTNALQPGRMPEEIWEELRSIAADSVLLAGHEPLFGYLTGFLLSTPSLLIDVKKGSIVRIDVEQSGPRPRGVLRWYLTPKLAAPRR
jgi:phosphohistidine phosphatase